MAYNQIGLTEISAPPHSRARLRAALAKTALKAAFSAAVVVGALSAGQAQAVIVTVDLGQGAGPQQWDVTTFTGTYNANSSKFETPANGGVMPWWTPSPIGLVSSSLAQSFATAVGHQLGLFPLNGGRGPNFGYQTVNGEEVSYARSFRTPGCCATGGEAWDSDHTWAQATLVTPAPGPLPALGAAAAFGFSRKLRQRINVSKAVAASITAA